MHAEFGIQRERENKLFLKRYKNDKGALHFHSQIELYFVDEGEMEVFVNDKRRVLKAGEFSIAMSYTPHSYKTPSHSRSHVLIIPPYLCEGFVAATQNKRITNPFISDKAVFEKISACYEEIEKSENNEIKSIGFVYVILGLILECSDFEKVDETIDTQLSTKILSYINENFKSDISLSTISQALGYCPSYISRYFKACFNIGFNEYLTTVRLKNALMLIHEKKHSMTYCAFESGFNSMRTFYRVFMNEFKCSPKEFDTN